jgi:gamma-glutamyltranspeptidase/glutathione hydrolase
LRACHQFLCDRIAAIFADLKSEAFFMLRRSFLVYILVASFLSAPFSVANTVSGSNGVVSSRSQIASDVGIDILRQGGNAVDSAVAVGFA